jgi:hypothetical protein
MHTLLPELSKTPLNAAQHGFFQQFVASLSPEQLAWAGGYLTGFCRHAASDHEGIFSRQTAVSHDARRYDLEV